MPCELSIVVPVYNEEPENLSRLLEALESTLAPLSSTFEVIFVDDGSKLATKNACLTLVEKHPHVKLVALSRNYGEQAAISAGLDHATGQAVINMDSDMQDPPALIPKMLEYWRQGYDVVLTSQASRKESPFRQFCSFAYYRLLNAFSTVQIPVDAGEFRLLSRRAVDVICAMPEQNKFFRGTVPWIGLRQIVIPFDRDARDLGTSTYTGYKLMKLAMEGLVAFNMRPLYFIPFCGMTLMLIALPLQILAIIASGEIYYRLAFEIAAILFAVSGVQIFCTGLVAIYLAEVLKEVRHRPTYIVDQLFGFQTAPEHIVAPALARSPTSV